MEEKQSKTLWAGLIAVEGLWHFSTAEQLQLQQEIFARLNNVFEHSVRVCFRVQHCDFLFITHFPSASLNTDTIDNESQIDACELLYAEQIAHKIETIFQQAFETENFSHHFFPQIGLASSRFENFSVNNWISHAQLALHSAKEKQQLFAVFSPAQKHKKSEIYRIQSDLKRAILDNGFDLHYQPKIDLITGKCVGAEALARWDRPGHGSVSPVTFVPILENNYLMNDFGTHILHLLSAQFDKWTQQNIPNIPLSLNVSPLQLSKNPTGFARFEYALKEVLQMHPSLQLDIELTEGTIMQDLEWSSSIIERLKAYGVTFSIDDFGKGFSSLSYLKTLPVTCLKIDKIFLDDLCESKQSEAIVSAIIYMAHQLNMTVIAEGVETAEQYKKLCAMKCDFAQGYFIARPMSAHNFALWLNNNLYPENNIEPDRDIHFALT